MLSYGISIVVGGFMLINALLGFAGKNIPFAGQEQYTKESVKKMSRKMSIPYLICSIFFFVALILDMMGKASYEAYFISIGVLVIVFIIHIIVDKKTLVKSHS